jgi:hypothetical protein
VQSSTVGDLAGSGTVDGQLRLFASHENVSTSPIELGYCVLSEDTTAQTTLTVTTQSSSETGTDPIGLGASAVETFYEHDSSTGVQTQYTLGDGGFQCNAMADVSPGNWMVAIEQLKLVNASGDLEPMYVREWYAPSGTTPTWDEIGAFIAPPAARTEIRTTISHGSGTVSPVTYSEPSAACTAEEHSASNCGVGVDVDSNNVSTAGVPNTASTCEYGTSPPGSDDYLAICSQATTSAAPADDQSVIIEDNATSGCSGGVAWCAASDPLGWNGSTSNVPSEYEEGEDHADGCTTAGFYCGSGSDRAYEFNYGEYGMDLELQFASSEGAYQLALAAVDEVNGSDISYGWQNIVILDDNTGDVYYSGQQFANSFDAGEFQQDIASSSGAIDLNTMMGAFDFDPIRFILMKNN